MSHAASSTPTDNPLIAKLAHAALLTDADQALLEKICARTRRVEAKKDLICQGDDPYNVHLVLDGWACRYKVLPDGSRQNTALFLPGDFCDLHIAILGRMDHSIAALTPCIVVDIARDTIVELTQDHPRIARALWWCTLVDEATLREWLVNVGQREAPQRIAHLFYEILVRLRAVGRASGNGYELALTQVELADTVSMTPVHVNRVLQLLRERGLIVLKNRFLSIPDVEKLKAYCDFDPAYLHLADDEGREQQHR